MSDPFYNAKLSVMLSNPFFSSVVMKRTMVEDNTLPTVAIGKDGRIYYNTEFVESLTLKEQMYVLCHECMHYLGMDHQRRQGRQRPAWNWACDAVINAMLDGMKHLERPKFGVQPIHNKTKEEVYAEMPTKNVTVAMGDIQNERGADNPVPEHIVGLELAEAVHAAQRAGALPASMQRFAEAILRPKVHWKDRLARWLTDVSYDDYSWKKPNRRVPNLYLPSLRINGAAKFAFFGIDTSGSIEGKQLEKFVSEVKEVLEQVQVSEVKVVCVDTDVYECGDGNTFDIKGGGGTDLRKLDAYVMENALEPSFAIWLTDGYTPWPEFVDYPLLVLSTDEAAPESLCQTFSIKD